MQKDKAPRFSQLVCGPSQVQTAFESHNPTRIWWQLILMLHGKPVNPSLPLAERTRRIADGFKFYAWLYRFLAVIFLLLASALLTLNMPNNSLSSSYWAITSALAAFYLWCVSGLGFAGAAVYAAGAEQGRGQLVAFMVMVVAFLSMFIAVVSVVAHQGAWLAVLPNVAAATALFVFGVGSYLIEIIYLATETPS